MNSLDAQLSKLISKFWKTDNAPTLLLWVYYTKQSFRASLLDGDYGQNCCSKYSCCEWDQDSPLFSDLRKLIHDPSRRTKQMLDTLCDANIGAYFMKVLLLQRCSLMQVLMQFLCLYFLQTWYFVRYYGIHHSCCELQSPQHSIQQFVVEYLPHILPDQKIGECIARIEHHQSGWFDWAYGFIFHDNCPTGISQCIDHIRCEQLQRHQAQRRFKQVHYLFSQVCVDYFQVSLILFWQLIQ